MYSRSGHTNSSFFLFCKEQGRPRLKGINEHFCSEGSHPMLPPAVCICRAVCLSRLQASPGAEAGPRICFVYAGTLLEENVTLF